MAGGISPLLPLITSRSSSQGWGSGGSAFVPNLPKPRSAEETALQKLEAEWLKQHKGGSLLGSVLHGSWKGISKALDFIARPSYAVAEGTRRALHGESNSFDFGKFLSGALSGLEGHSHTGFGQGLGDHPQAEFVILQSVRCSVSTTSEASGCKARWVSHLTWQPTPSCWRVLRPPR